MQIKQSRKTKESKEETTKHHTKRNVSFFSVIGIIAMVIFGLPDLLTYIENYKNKPKPSFSYLVINNTKYSNHIFSNYIFTISNNGICDPLEIKTAIVTFENEITDSYYDHQEKPGTKLEYAIKGNCIELVKDSNGISPGEEASFLVLVEPNNHIKEAYLQPKKGKKVMAECTAEMSWAKDNLGRVKPFFLLGDKK